MLELTTVGTMGEEPPIVIVAAPLALERAVEVPIVRRSGNVSLPRPMFTGFVPVYLYTTTVVPEDGLICTADVPADANAPEADKLSMRKL